jgi:hypothetical protein
VGSYAFLGRTSKSASTAGSTYAGSGLNYHGINAYEFGSSANLRTNISSGQTGPAGTWRLMGYGYTTTRYLISVFVRIS